jgi:hypothetical protein
MYHKKDQRYQNYQEILLLMFQMNLLLLVVLEILLQ